MYTLMCTNTGRSLTHVSSILSADTVDRKLQHSIDKFLLLVMNRMFIVLATEWCLTHGSPSFLRCDLLHLKAPLVSHAPTGDSIWQALGSVNGPALCGPAAGEGNYCLSRSIPVSPDFSPGWEGSETASVNIEA